MTDNIILNRDAILAVQDVKTERISVPEWGGDVFVRVMTGTERDTFEETMLKNKSTVAGVRGRLASICLVDEAGTRLFTESDVEALGKKSAAALDKVCSAASRLNGFNAKDIEDLAKN